MAGRLVGIARAPALRAPLEEVAAAAISLKSGLEGDARGRKRRRQVTVLFREGWDEACHQIGIDLPWTIRRANLFVAGLERPTSSGGVLLIGVTELEITMETDPCEMMERACSGLRAALEPDWRGGVCCAVLRGGEIRVGDAVSYSAG